MLQVAALQAAIARLESQGGLGNELLGPLWQGQGTDFRTASEDLGEESP